MKALKIIQAKRFPILVALLAIGITGTLGCAASNNSPKSHPSPPLDSRSGDKSAKDKPAIEYLVLNDAVKPNESIIVTNKHLKRSIHIDYVIKDKFNGNPISQGRIDVGKNGSANLGVAVANWKYVIVAASFID